MLQALKIPDIVTLSNALFGMGAMVSASNGHYELACILLLIAAVADGVDGYLARRLTSSEFGEAMDSLADIISFGVAPAFVVYSAYSALHSYLIGLAACFYIVCGILRLARFSSIHNTTHDFEGLPVTAGSVMISSYLLIYEKYITAYSVAALVVILSLLMISTFTYPKLSNIKTMAPVSVIFGLVILSFFVNMDYTQSFSFVLFLAMVLYVASPIINSNKGFKKGLNE
ncbi:MAG: archaetidylserine synthase [Methanosarcinaceae archaeon]